MSQGKKPKAAAQPVVALDPVAYRELKEQERLEKTADTDPAAAEQLQQKDSGSLGLLLKTLQMVQAKQADRMSFEVDPSPTYQTYSGLYRSKAHLTPDHIIKRIIGASGDDLVCQILQARSNHIASYGRPRMSRFSMGFEFEEIPGINLSRDKKLQEQINDRIEKAKKIFWNCGLGPAKKEYFTPNFSQYLKMITRDGVAYGRFATEILWVKKPGESEEQFYGFRPADTGTIYHVAPSKEEDHSIRQQAVAMLQRLRNDRIEANKWEEDHYKWVQVIEGVPRQAFSEREMVVYNLYPTTNIEYNGYPLTPIDQALNAITTHISITIHNKLYFQHGRAARGMLIFKSDSIDESTVQKVRLQFHQSINSASNSWRMPVFGIGTEDDLQWTSIDVSGRDAEFQYLMDQNARVILSAFQMSPEELPGYAHLARGTTTQALSESNNEWKLTAARDVGLRPLIADIQDFLNSHILPKVDPELAKTHRIILAGLEKQDPDKEAAQLQTDMNLHMTFNDVLQAVEKEMLPEGLGGNLPLNQMYQQSVLGPYLTVGEILENFFGKKGAASDPRYNYYRDPFWMQYQQLIIQQAQMAMQSQMAQQQAMMQQQQGMMQQQGGAPDQEGGQDAGPPPQEEQAPPGADEAKKAEIAAYNLRKKQEWMTQNYVALDKSITSNGRKISEMILKRHKEMVEKHLDEWEKKTKEAISQIAEIAGGKKS